MRDEGVRVTVARMPRKATPSKKSAETAASTQRPNAGAREDWSSAYLEALTLNGGQMVAAAFTAGIVATTVQRRRNSDAEFAKRERDALALANDICESEARRRAIEGVESTFYDKDGNMVRTKIEYSDTILLRLLERLETGSWRQKQQIDVNAPGSFATRAERLAALEKARAEDAAAQKPASAIAKNEP